jgi:hypothetical protein
VIADTITGVPNQRNQEQRTKSWSVRKKVFVSNAVRIALPPRRLQSFGQLLVHAAIRGSLETCSISELASLTRLTNRTLQRRCREARTTAKAAVDFVKCLQIVLDTSGAWDPAAQLSLSVSDTRTINRLLKRCGLETAVRPTVDAFLSSQQLITSERVLSDIREALASRRTAKKSPDGRSVT